eukprot:CAMPEP_0184232106 /NCGR_PEP_ID=MMETSP0976-20121227/23619_1 /TAXON_ID=483370 /ORGANISM="non described non described, Strain CCMP2097" /LENGTH=67 /DNA_ID=CAMNT_0026537121 /DNA_START=486 /DNA_END=686 /DNA_ORIENTATION=+
MPPGFVTKTAVSRADHLRERLEDRLVVCLKDHLKAVSKTVFRGRLEYRLEGRFEDGRPSSGRRDRGR